MAVEPYTHGAQPPLIKEFFTSSSWKHALFTTYALSLSYFESEVLHPLLRAGCDDIWLVADAEGYRRSLLERRSMRVGQEYRLIPAALPNGVFHAKCIYLSGDEEDLLLIGSGNVTFGGHGRNAEVFEALSPDGAASAFLDFAAFLEFLASRPDLHIPRTDWVENFAARARSAAMRGSNGLGIPVHLVHSLDAPIDRQLTNLLTPYGVPLHATVMSPYHDPDGFALQQLIKAVPLPKVSVAITQTEFSSFPFAAISTWGVPVTAVRRQVPDNRFVHAKWFEFLFENDRILLTGSINATRKALTTTENVEIGVLRHFPASDPASDWMPADIPFFKPNDRMPSGLGQNEIVFASFDQNDPNRLYGQLITSRPPAGLWQVRLVQADGESISSEAHVDDSGRFAFRAKEIESFSQLPAVQILLTLNGRSARGWVHNDIFLGIRARRRLTAGALSRLMRREGTDDDIQALLDYLCVAAEHHLRLFSQPIRGKDPQDAGAETAEKTISVHIDELAPLKEIEHAAGVSYPAAPPDDQFNTAMNHLRRMLLGHGRGRRKSTESGSTSTLAEEDLEGGRERPSDEIAYTLGLYDFERAIENMIAQGGDPAVRNGLLAMLLEVVMSMRLYRLDDRDGAYEFLNGWFFKAYRLSQADLAMSTSFQQHVLTTAATLLALSPAGDARAVLATSLHDALEKFYRGPVDRDHALRSLISDPQTGFAAMLAADTVELDLTEALKQILVTRTRRRQLADALTLAEKAEPVPTDWPVFQSNVGKNLWETLQQPNWQRRVRIASAGRNACAFDYFTFAVQEAAQFEHERIGRCIHCQRFTVNTTP